MLENIQKMLNMNDVEKIDIRKIVSTGKSIVICYDDNLYLYDYEVFKIDDKYFYDLIYLDQILGENITKFRQLMCSKKLEKHLRDYLEGKYGKE